MRTRATVIALLEIVFGAFIFLSSFWLSHSMHDVALFLYGVVVAAFGLATLALLRR